jgi:integrase
MFTLQLQPLAARHQDGGAVGTAQTRDLDPSRDKRVKLPTVIDEEPQPPTASQFLALLDAIPARWVLPLVTVEQTAMTVGEAEALAWGDVDVAGCQFRLRRSTVKAQIRSRARWVQVPEWLMDELALTCPLEDRNADRKVFAGFTGDGAKNAMARACKLAGITHFHPHDLRHRRIRSGTTAGFRRRSSPSVPGTPGRP